MKSGYGYEFKRGIAINQLLYVDDIKLYAKNERDINSLIHLTRIYSENIEISFKLEKCDRMVVKREKVITTNGMDLPS